MGPQILSVQREKREGGGATLPVISCFLIPRTRARCPPGQTQTLIVTVGSYGRFCVEPEEFIDGGNGSGQGPLFLGGWRSRRAGRCLGAITILGRVRCFQLIFVLAAVPLANSGNHKLLDCLAGLKWEYRKGAAADRDHFELSSRCQTMTENKSLRGRRQSWQQ